MIFILFARIRPQIFLDNIFLYIYSHFWGKNFVLGFLTLDLDSFLHKLYKTRQLFKQNIIKSQMFENFIKNVLISVGGLFAVF